MRVMQGRGAQSSSEEPALLRNGKAMLETQEDSCRRRQCEVNVWCGMLRISVFISLLLTDQLFFVTWV